VLRSIIGIMKGALECPAIKSGVLECAFGAEERSSGSLGSHTAWNYEFRPAESLDEPFARRDTPIKDRN
jgi:hypothetical protein